MLLRWEVIHPLRRGVLPNGSAELRGRKVKVTAGWTRQRWVQEALVFLNQGASRMNWEHGAPASQRLDEDNKKGDWNMEPKHTGSDLCIRDCYRITIGSASGS